MKSVVLLLNLGGLITRLTYIIEMISKASPQNAIFFSECTFTSSEPPHQKLIIIEHHIKRKLKPQGDVSQLWLVKPSKSRLQVISPDIRHKCRSFQTIGATGGSLYIQLFRSFLDDASDVGKLKWSIPAVPELPTHKLMSKIKCGFTLPLSFCLYRRLSNQGH